ncbi:MAG: HAMP domain-containing sensor histidine kinase [Microgenomates group bacterium]
MGQVRFATKLRYGIVVLTTLSVTLACLGLSVGIFIHTELHVKDELIGNVNKVIAENLTVVDGKILQKTMEGSQTLGSLLRLRDLSALIVDKQGQVIAKYGIYRDLDGEYLKIIPVKTGKYEDIILADYGLFDTYTVPIKAGNDVFGYMKMMRKNSEILILKQTIGLVVAIIFPLTWVLSLIFAYFMIKRVTNPLNRLVGHLEKIDHESMKVIADSPLMDHEVLVVTHAINDLIVKLREHHKRERQITENISHEFKTPLTRIVGDLQVGKYKAAEQEVLELGGNVDALLSLAIWEKTEEKADLVPIIKHLVKLIPSGLNTEIKLPKKMMTPLPYSHLQIVLRNLIDNAIKHNIKKGKIWISGQMEDGSWLVMIKNTTKNVVDDERITQRKYKTGGAEGQGIGMAIVAEMCKLHGLRLEVSEDEGEVTTMISG